LAILSPAIPTSKTVQLGIAVIAIASLIALLYFGREFFVTSLFRRFLLSFWIRWCNW
jgi:hypothetical protein